jgi:polar amino acid transport system substrate-binding protein
MHYKTLFAALFLTGLAHAQPVTLVSGDDYKPYADSKLPDGGMTTELVKKALAEVKQDIKVDWLPWKRGLDETKDGKFAGTFPYLRTPEREKDFLYSDPIVKIQDFPFVKGGAKKFNFSKIETLAGSTICLPLGWAPTPKLVEMIKTKSIKVESPKDLSTCVKMVATNRADYFITDEAQGLATLKVSGLAVDSVVMTDVPLADTTLYLIAGKDQPGSKALLASFNKGMEAIRKNGIYAKVVKAHSK